MIIKKENSSLELDADRVKKKNLSAGTLNVITHLTNKLPIGLGSYNLLSYFISKRRHRS